MISGRESFDWPLYDRGRPAAPRDIGEHLTKALRAVVKQNPTLSGVIDVVDFAAERNGEREINPAKLRGVVETFSDPRYRLGLADVQLDFRGRAYEYPLKLVYHSMKSGPGHREIVPHALVDSGLRWHVRAYDRTKQEFRDLVLTRMEQVSAYAARSVHALIKPHERLEADEQWQRYINLELIPHPAQRHPESVMRDYGMTEGRLQVTLRAAVAGYVLRQWQVDCSPDATLNGPEYRLRLANLAQLDGVGNAVPAPGYSFSERAQSV